eukprot:11211543-Lingulodinium_polyedra.AAC.1
MLTTSPASQRASSKRSGSTNSYWWQGTRLGCASPPTRARRSRPGPYTRQWSRPCAGSPCNAAGAAGSGGALASRHA